MPKSARILILTAFPFLNVFGEDPISFDRDIQPILSENCYYCHGTDPKHREGDLRLDLREDALDAGAIVPGKPEESELVDRIHSKDPDDLMPPLDSNRKLTAEQKDLLAR
ncbi:MAG: c-type cytochrome domain-containing protein, partial [Akkermansiaceae bacterium]